MFSSVSLEQQAERSRVDFDLERLQGCFTTKVLGVSEPFALPPNAVFTVKYVDFFGQCNKGFW